MSSLNKTALIFLQGFTFLEFKQKWKELRCSGRSEKMDKVFVIYSHCSNEPAIEITDCQFLFRWVNLSNQQGNKDKFPPL